MKQEISISKIKGVQIGQAENAAAGTGCTVFLARNGMKAGLDVRGGGPASRESELLKPMAAAQEIHGIVLAGGSAFGLGAADGVMKYLEEKGIGFDVGVTRVPLVCQSDLFDLTVGDPFTRPDGAMGYEACKNAEKGNYRDGNFGAGCGATVGKFAGMDFCMKSGIGSYAVEIGALQVGAVVAVNALGDIYDWKTGRKIAGLLSEDKKSFRQTEELLYADRPVSSLSGGERVKLQLACLRMARPDALLLDEPSMGLAPILVEQIFDIIQDLNRKGSTILLVEQNAQMALSVAHRGYVMETGKIVATGSGAELIESPEIKRAYLGG